MSTPPPRPSWPLYLLAGLAFLPVMGFFIGSVALTWGLLSGRPGARRASVIAATGALLNVAGMVLLLTTGMEQNGALREGFIASIQQDLGRIVVALEEHHDETRSYPPSLPALNQARGPLRAVSITEMGPGVLRMRLSRNYQYILSPDGSGYYLFSVGRDGKPGTSDDIRPLVPDSLIGRTGLKSTP
jgi:hypothetical protein